ncbi:MAG: hypothetical protein WCJ55_10060 [Chloroflexales bacterium]
MDTIYIIWQELDAAVPMQQRLDSAIAAHLARFGGAASHFNMPKGAAGLGLSFPAGSEVCYVDHVQPYLIQAGHVIRRRANPVADRVEIPISVVDRVEMPISVVDRVEMPISAVDRVEMPISVSDRDEMPAQLRLPAAPRGFRSFSGGNG